MKRTITYTLIIFLSVFVCLVVIKAVTTSEESDKTLQQVDRFIEEHETTGAKYKRSISEVELETVSLSYTEPELSNTADNFDVMTPEEFQEAGVIDWNGWRFTYYSEQVLPGDGLQIPGRWSDGTFVRDENGYLCVACNDLEQGTVVATPFGEAIVYDWVGDDVHGLIDIYVSW